jgi:hypothetical protein
MYKETAIVVSALRGTTMRTKAPCSLTFMSTDSAVAIIVVICSSSGGNVEGCDFKFFPSLAVTYVTVRSNSRFTTVIVLCEPRYLLLSKAGFQYRNTPFNKVLLRLDVRLCSIAELLNLGKIVEFSKFFVIILFWNNLAYIQPPIFHGFHGRHICIEKSFEHDVDELAIRGSTAQPARNIGIEDARSANCLVWRDTSADAQKASRRPSRSKDVKRFIPKPALY